MTQVPKTWTAKDPEARQDYVYRIPLDPSDTVDTYEVEKVSGDVVLENGPTPGIATADTTTEDGYGQDVGPIWLSEGTEGEINVLRVSWVTVGGREDDAIILLPIFANEPVDLALTDYAKPTAAHLILRYPVFTAVPVSTIAYWLTDAERYVTDAWSEGDYAAGLMSLAAHNMALAGLGTQAAAVSGIPAGVKSFKSGSFSAEFTEQQANASASGSLESTRYGQEYAALLRRNRAGARVTPTGVAPTLEYPPYGGIAGF